MSLKPWREIARPHKDVLEDRLSNPSLLRILLLLQLARRRMIIKTRQNSSRELLLLRE